MIGANDNASVGWHGRLVVDAVFFQDWGSGITRVWRELLLEWARLGFAPRVAIVDRARTAPRIGGYWYIDSPRFELSNDLQERQRLGEICRLFGANAFASTFFTVAHGVPNLLLLHDMIPERLGDMRLPMWQQKQRAIGAAAGFAVVSQSTMSDFKRFYPLEAMRPIVLAPNGVSPHFCPPSETEIATFRESFCGRHLGGRPHILFISDGGGYKNGEIVRQALRIWKNRSRYALLVTARPESAEEWYPAPPDMPLAAAYLSDDDLRLAYGTAYCLMHPSDYEGFGLAILEAMACGCPVICSSTGSQAEVAGDAALFVNPYDPQSLIVALDEIAKPETRARLRQRGLERAREFTWGRSASQLDSLLQRMAPA